MMRPLKLRRDLTDVLKEKDKEINRLRAFQKEDAIKLAKQRMIIREFLEYEYLVNMSDHLIARAEETIS